MFTSCIRLIHASYIKFLFQDSVKINDITKESEEAAGLIPQLEDEIPKLQKLLADEESVLEEIKENSKGSMVFYDHMAYNGEIFVINFLCCFIVL